MSNTRDDILRFAVKTETAAPPPEQAKQSAVRVVVELPISDDSRFTLAGLVCDLVDRGLSVSWTTRANGYHLAAIR